MMKKFPLMVAVLGLALLAGAANACVTLDEAMPKVGSTVSAPLESVTVMFSGGIVVEKSSLSVTGPDGKSVVSGQIMGMPPGKDNKKTGLSVPVSVMKPGVYKVKWTAQCTDCPDAMPGSYSFTVK